MKTKLFLFALLAIYSFFVSAQSNNSYQSYLDKAMSSLEKGDCKKALKWYNMYKNLSGKTVSSVELLIQDCENSNSAPTYAINDKIKVGDYIYTIAYIEDGGAHGFAIYDCGVGNLTSEMIKDRKVPTYAEMKIIAQNADILKLERTKYYWMIEHLKGGSQHHFIFRLTDGNVQIAHQIHDKYGRLLIYRF